MELKEYLIKHKLSARDFAKISQVDISAIYRIMRGSSAEIVNAYLIHEATGGLVKIKPIKRTKRKS